ncbi:hypothetical protein F4781DRAFT_389253 [Annulohypoxylon bovei var. microspora]|nr:hypothetical protein F4781DRAFT_389253 [Annulohypoxylon bovei var. microspora]
MRACVAGRNRAETRAASPRCEPDLRRYLCVRAYVRTYTPTPSMRRGDAKVIGDRKRSRLPVVDFSGAGELFYFILACLYLLCYCTDLHDNYVVSRLGIAYLCIYLPAYIIDVCMYLAPYLPLRPSSQRHNPRSSLGRIGSQRNGPTIS